MENQHGGGTWVVGGIVGILGLLGLFLAANAHEQIFYGVGLALFMFACGFIFFLIKHAFDGHQS